SAANTLQEGQVAILVMHAEAIAKAEGPVEFAFPGQIAHFPLRPGDRKSLLGRLLSGHIEEGEREICPSHLIALGSQCEAMTAAATGHVEQFGSRRYRQRFLNEACFRESLLCRRHF